jgi:hypothetical protein
LIVSICRNRKGSHCSLRPAGIPVSAADGTDHVGNVDIAASSDRFDDLGQQLTARPTNGALNIFIAPGASPTNIKSAFGLPTQTPLTSRERVQLATRAVGAIDSQELRASACVTRFFAAQKGQRFGGFTGVVPGFDVFMRCGGRMVSTTRGAPGGFATEPATPSLSRTRDGRGVFVGTRVSGSDLAMLRAAVIVARSGSRRQIRACSAEGNCSSPVADDRHGVVSDRYLTGLEHIVGTIRSISSCASRCRCNDV